ncbi:MAG: GFA family protein [Candidatus Binataceae bacterium]
MATISGGCLCGQVRYEAEGEPLAAVRCHCRDCQYVCGGEPADVVVFPSSTVRCVRGEARVFWSKADSGTPVFRSFCANCGTPLFAGNEQRPKMLAVKIGSLDEPSRYPPIFHIWTSSAQAWHHIDPTQPAFPKNRTA